MNIKTKKAAIIQGDKYRISILTSQLIRFEYSESGIFEDRATQAIVNRNFEVLEFNVINKENEMIITTKDLLIRYDRKKFSSYGLSIKLLGNFCNHGDTWFYSMDYLDLKGTTKTLDRANGEVPLSKGLISKNGFTVYDDSKSLIITDDQWFEPRTQNSIDIYFFGYGRDYKKCLLDFYKLTGNTPLLPKFALGNWWSRYYKYTEESYKKLIENFEKRGIPISVAVLDMDWHLTEIDPKYGSGWTGYTWNKEFFPSPKRFLNWLHEKGFKVTLNVHPASGVRAFEDDYLPMAKELKIDYEKEEPIEFDITNKKFIKAYFKFLHHPKEEEGVDFWWIDWQQQTHSKIEGLDPLWALNHLHYLDNARTGKIPLTFSRYSGIGSHRYPIGFSGDTIITWESLDFQPYFTATASNVGYGWWSHDIGGHMRGYRDEELQLRWLQLGVFSPINRLHSSNNEFCGKEVWNYSEEIENKMTSFLKLRHKLIPYLHTMNKLASEGRPLILPMYYEYPWEENAYNVKNQYFFGTECFVAPITSPSDKKLKLGKVNVWLPKGVWFDIFTGIKYLGNRKISMFRDLSSIPVLAKEGSIIPLSGEVTNSLKNPKDLTVLLFDGKDGEFTLWEDFEENKKYTNSWCSTKFLYNSALKKFTISKPQGDLNILPEKRRIKLEIYGLNISNIKVIIDEQIIKNFEISNLKNKSIILLPEIDIKNSIIIEFTKYSIIENDILEKVYHILNVAEIEYSLKTQIFEIIKKYSLPKEALSELISLNLDNNLLDSLSEIILSY